jgi:lysophospholipid acyltransferase
MVSLAMKSRYYIGWTMSDAASCASGQMYNGQDVVTKEEKFDRYSAINKMGVESSVFSSAVTEFWNLNAHVWLKRYVYFRMNRKMNREVALYLTYVLSAFWHGFYPIYFAAFIFYAIVTENYKEIYKLYFKYSFLRSPPFVILF